MRLEFGPWLGSGPFLGGFGPEKGLQVELCLPAALKNTVLGKAAWVEGLQAGGHVHRRRLDALRTAQTVTDGSEVSTRVSSKAQLSDF